MHSPLAWLAVFTLLAPAGCGMEAHTQSGPGTRADTTAESPPEPYGEPLRFDFTVEEISHTPRHLRIVGTSRPQSYPDTVALRIRLPDGLSLVSGDTAWTGRVTPETSNRLEMIVEAEGPGYYEVGNTFVYVSITSDDHPVHPSMKGEPFAFEVTPSGVVPNSRAPNHWALVGSFNGTSCDQEGLDYSFTLSDPAPAVGDTLTVTYTVRAPRDADAVRTSLDLILPVGAFEIVGATAPGDTEPEQSGHPGETVQLMYVGPGIERGHTQTLSAVLRVLTEGESPLAAMSSVWYSPTHIVLNSRALTLHVDRYRSWLAPFPDPVPCGDYTDLSRPR